MSILDLFRARGIGRYRAKRHHSFDDLKPGMTVILRQSGTTYKLRAFIEERHDVLNEEGWEFFAVNTGLRARLCIDRIDEDRLYVVDTAGTVHDLFVIEEVIR